MSALNQDEKSGNGYLLESQDQGASNKAVQAIHPQLPQNLGARLGNLGALPEHILRQLKSTDNEEVEILDILREFEGVAAIDEIFVRQYERRPGETHDRTQLSRKLYRMMKRGVIYPFQGRRGFYTTRVDLAGDQEAEGELDSESI